MSIVLFAEIGSWAAQQAIQDAKLKPNAREVLRQLALEVKPHWKFMKTKGKYTQCDPTRKFLMEKTFLGHAAVDRAIRELVAAGFISVKHRKKPDSDDWDSNLYTINRNALGIVWPPGKWDLAPKSPEEVETAQETADDAQEDEGNHDEGEGESA